MKARLALTQWTRSAGQRNIDALVKVADYHYHGLGLSDGQESDADVKFRLEKAAKYYQSASETHLSALAMWNLGWLYENGAGIPQVCYTSSGIGKKMLTESLIRISISLSAIMTWLWRRMRKRTCLVWCRW